MEICLECRRFEADSLSGDGELDEVNLLSRCPDVEARGLSRSEGDASATMEDLFILAFAAASCSSSVSGVDVVSVSSLSSLVSFASLVGSESAVLMAFGVVVSVVGMDSSAVEATTAGST